MVKILLKKLYRLCLSLLGVLVFIFLLGLIYLMVALHFSSHRFPYVSRQIRSFLAARTNDRVTIERMSFSAKNLFFIVIDVHNLRLHDAQNQTILHLPENRFSINIFNLLTGRLKFQEAELNNLEITLDRRQLKSASVQESALYTTSKFMPSRFYFYSLLQRPLSYNPQALQQMMTLKSNPILMPIPQISLNPMSDFTMVNSLPQQTVQHLDYYYQSLVPWNLLQHQQWLEFSRTLGDELERKLKNFFLLVDHYQSYVQVIRLQNLIINLVGLNYQQQVETNSILVSTKNLHLINNLQGEEQNIQLKVNNAKAILLTPESRQQLQQDRDHRQEPSPDSTWDLIQRYQQRRNARAKANSRDIFTTAPKSQQFSLGFSCLYKNESDYKCTLSFQQLQSSLLADIVNGTSAKLEEFLDNTQATFNGKLTMHHVRDNQLPIFQFSAQSRKGQMQHPALVANSVPLPFEHLILQLKIFNNLQDIDIERFSMTLLGRIPLELRSTIRQHTRNIDIRLKHVEAKDLPLLWLEIIPAKDIKAWLIQHLQQATVDHASINFDLQQGKLKRLRAQFPFRDGTLQYDSDYPVLTDLQGQAFFTEKKMRLHINGGKVLNSQLSNATITIPDFDPPDPQQPVRLEIKGNIKGETLDIFRYLDLTPAPDTPAWTLFNLLKGNSHSQLNLSLPLGDNDLDFTNDLALEAKVDSQVLQPNLIFSQPSQFYTTVTKPAGQEDLDLQLDLTNSALALQKIHVYKDPQTAQQLEFRLAIDGSKHTLALQNLKANGVMRGTGEVIFDLQNLEAPLLVNIHDYQYRHNNFSATFDRQKDYFSLVGKSIDLQWLMEHFKEQLANDPKIQVEKNPIADPDYHPDDESVEELPLEEATATIAPDQSSIPPADTLPPSHQNFYFLLDIQQIYLSSQYTFNDIHLELKQTNGKWDFVHGSAVNFPGGVIRFNRARRWRGRPQSLPYQLYISGFDYLLNIVGGTEKIKDFGDIELQGELFRSKHGSLVTSGRLSISRGFTVVRPQTQTKPSETSDKTPKTPNDNDRDTVKYFKIDRCVVYFNLDSTRLMLNNGILHNGINTGITINGQYNFYQGDFDFRGAVIPLYMVNNLFSLNKIPLVGNIISLIKGGNDGGLFATKFHYSRDPSPNAVPILKIYYLQSLAPGFLREIFTPISQ